ncbi:MAG: hypothetical protein K940chlam2_01769, partial [Chlamydiae bacterium]|nr:hypothetical protein [Chlamydiota bacterium]
IIMTSNLGAELIRRSSEVGFGVGEGMIDYKTMQQKIEGAVKKGFKPEFLNRLDGLVIFKSLDKSELLKVVDLEISKVQTRLARRNLFITLDNKAKDLLVTKGYQPEMGARPLRRAIENELEDQLAEKILLNPDQEGNWLVTVENDKFIFLDQGVPSDAKDNLATMIPKKED